jgi:hypothetical protein
MTKERAALSFGFATWEAGQQVPPLRYAPVGMTLLFASGMKKGRAEYVGLTRR